MNLNPLTPTDNAKKLVEYLGDVDEVLRMAKADYDFTMHVTLPDVDDGKEKCYNPFGKIRE